MKLFHAEPEKDDVDDMPVLHAHLDDLEKTVTTLREIVGQRRAMLQQAEKTLQEFQDMIYAMLIEADAPKRTTSFTDEPDDDDPFNIENPLDVSDVFPEDER